MKEETLSNPDDFETPSGEQVVSDALLAVKLSAFEWHEVLNELAYGMRFVNRDSSVNKRLLERIATQLNGAPVKYEG